MIMVMVVARVSIMSLSTRPLACDGQLIFYILDYPCACGTTFVVELFQKYTRPKSVEDDILDGVITPGNLKAILFQLNKRRWRILRQD